MHQVSSELTENMDNIINVSFMAGMTIENADGIIGYTKTNKLALVDIFNRLGYAFEVEEKDIEKVTALLACGLGFAAYILNSFQKTGIALGVSAKISEGIVAKTFENNG